MRRPEAFRLIAHRGASGRAPENTLAAFSKALDLGAAAVEFDVQQTKDGRLVVIHDLDLRRVARTSRTIRSLDWAGLSRLDAGAWFDVRFRGERVPLLEEVLGLIERRSPGRVELQLEIKNGRPPYEGIEARVLGALRARPEWGGRVVISSFDRSLLGRVRRLDPRARLGYLAGPERRPAALAEAKELGCESLHLSLRRASPAWAEAAHAAGLKLLVYTVNRAEDGRRLRRMGADGVFTNFPDLAL